MLAATLVALLTILALTCATGPHAGSTPRTHDGTGAADNRRLERLTQRIHDMRERTWSCQDQLGVKRTKASQARIRSARYARYVLKLWTDRAYLVCGIVEQMRVPAIAIRAVFGEHAGEALAVSSCESGQRTTAVNGQYQGMFQMGSSERAIYGHGDTPLEQTRAAYRYFVASGRDWSPWQCKPWGVV